MSIRYMDGGSGRKISVIIALIVLIVGIFAGGIYLSYTLFFGKAEDGMTGVNVTTGKLDVDIVNTAGQTLVGDVLEFIPDEGKEKVYFAPGSTYITEGFKVKNNGDIPLKFRVYISEGEKFDKEKFVEAFELYITTSPDGTKSEGITEFVDELDVGESSVAYFLVCRMKESAGNEFQGQAYEGIGITVHAAQREANLEE